MYGVRNVFEVVSERARFRKKITNFAPKPKKRLKFKFIDKCGH